MALDKRYLKKHGNQWLVVIKVPERLRRIVGKAHLKQPLHTDSLAVANREKFKHIAAMKAQLEEVEREQRRRDKLPADPLTEEALTWRWRIDQVKHDPEPISIDERGEIEEDTFSLTTLLLVDRAEEIEQREGRKTAKSFYEIATGKGTPIMSLVDRWLGERHEMKPRQRIDYRRAVVKFVDWLTASKLPATAEQCTRRIAGEYVSDFVERGVAVRTTNKDISVLSSFWRWLETKGLAEANIWREQSLKKPKESKKNDARPFTDDELATLLRGECSPLLKDFMTIAALSGMRIEEIARLTAENIVDGWAFDIAEAKTKAGVRFVPIHSQLKEIIERRTAGKRPEDPLFPELPVPKRGSAVERSQKVVKAFVTYRRRLGIDEVLEGRRQSRVTFHSFRRWFISRAEQARQPPHFISAVVGHVKMREGETLGRYSEGPLKSQYIEVVESVRLPVK